MRLRLRVAAAAVAFILIYSLYSLSNPFAWNSGSPEISIGSTGGKDTVPDRIQPSRATSGYFVASPTSMLKQASKVLSEVSTSVELNYPTSAPVSVEKEVPTRSETLVQSPLPLPSSTDMPRECVPYEQLQRLKQGPLSAGKRQFPYSRPHPECRTFRLPALEKLIERMKGIIKDPDLFRLFENSYPNTLDTMIKWRGFANATGSITGNQTITDEELAYVITGDIDAMWLRDSASQIYSYLPLLEKSADPNSLASLWRGVINVHSRYIIISPYCHSFQPPPESGVPPTHNGAYSQNHPNPPYDPVKVFDCKWELDSLASFLQISTAYYQRTNDLAFFQKYRWIEAVSAAVSAAGAMRLGTYAPDGKVQKSAWTFTGFTDRGTETLSNNGLGNPTKENGMVRSAFRPSDDACIYQLLVPANMMWAKHLEEASLIMEKLDGSQAKNLTTTMRDFAFGIRKAIDRDAVVQHHEFGDIWAYEIDGYGGVNLMDDANIPSLLSIPLFNYSQSSFPLPQPTKGEIKRNHAEIYGNTRRFVLNESNPYWAQGPVLSAVAGPHVGPGKAWPMAAIVRGLTAIISGNSTQGTQEGIEKEVSDQIRMVLDSTFHTGVVHESVNSWDESNWTRAWFGWANGLMGELVLKIAEQDGKVDKKDGEWLGRSWQ